MDERIEMTHKQAWELDMSGIVEFEGVNGKPTTVDIAYEAPMLCQMRSSAGRVYSLKRECGIFIATRVRDTNPDLVSPDRACTCGERRMDRLVWLDDGISAICTTCGEIFRPGGA